MPWTDYHPDVRQFSGLIQAAAYERFGSAATVQVVSLAARSAGIPLSFQAYSSIASIYGSFSRQRGANESLKGAFDTFQRTGLDQGITAQMVGQPPWSPSGTDWSLNPTLSVRVPYVVETPFGRVSHFFTMDYRLEQLHTVSQILADAEAQLASGAGSPAGPEFEIGTDFSISWAA